MNASIMCIGTELTRGEVADTNGAWLAAKLTSHGHNVATIEMVADEVEAITERLARLGSTSNLIVACGGLGPTSDDLTRTAVAQLLDVPLIRDQPSLTAISARMARFGRAIATSNAVQADFPQGATILQNRQGTAPGFLLHPATR